MKKKIISIALSTVIATNMMTVYGAGGLSDIGDSRYRDAIESIYDRDIMVGNEDGNFRPSDTITRAEFATAICRWKDLDMDGSSSFSDARGHWAEGAIGAVDDQGWMTGISSNSFNPNGKMTYQDALKVLVTSMGKDDEAQSFGGYPRGYTYIAEKYGLTENVSGSYDAPIYRGAVAQIIDNTRRLSNDDGELDEDRPENYGDYVESQEALDYSLVRVRKDIELGTVIERLPREVRVTLTSGKSIFIGIKWDPEETNYNQNSEGTYYIKGKLMKEGIADPDNVLRDVRASIEVVDEEAEQSADVINYVQRIKGQAKVDFGTALEDAKAKLPKEVKIYLIGGGSKVADIDWQIEGYDRLSPKTYKAKGEIILPENVSDRLDVVKPLEYDVILREESSTLGISSIEMISPKEYKIKTNRLIRSIVDGTVKIYKTGDGGDTEIIDFTVSHGQSESELIVKLTSPLKIGVQYKFEVKDSTLSGTGSTAEKTYTPQNKDFEIASIEVEDNIIPAYIDSDGDIRHLIDFTARNSEGLDITDAVRSLVTVKKNWDNAATTADNEFTLNLAGGEVKHFYLEYINPEDDEKKIRTEEKRIIGQTRRAQELVDWTISNTTPSTIHSWRDNENKYVQVEKAGKTLDLYLNVEDQFEDTEALRATDQDIDIEIIRGKDYIAEESKYDTNKLRLESFTVDDKLYNSVVSQIKFVEDLSAGTYIDLRVSVNDNISETIRIDIVADAKLSSLKADPDSIELSSSSELSAGDRSQTITIDSLDQRGDTIGLDGETIAYKIADGYGYNIQNGKIYKLNDGEEIEKVEFEDIEDSNYKKAIELLTEIGAINGYSDGKFHAEKTMTRAQFATIMVRLYGLEPSDVGDNIKDDLPSWADEFIRAIVKAGHMTLDEDGNFNPNENISYEDTLDTIVSIIGENDDDGSIRESMKKGISGITESDHITRGAVTQLIMNMLYHNDGQDNQIVEYLGDITTSGDNDEKFTIISKNPIDAQFDLDFYIDNQDLSVDSDRVSVNITNPDIAKTMIVQGFEDDLDLTESESLELDFFEIDSNGVKVKRIDENIDLDADTDGKQNIKLEIKDLSGEQDPIEYVHDGTTTCTIGNNIPELKSNKVYGIVITVGEIEILNQNLTVR